jgi:hypothetical protein
MDGTKGSDQPDGQRWLGTGMRVLVTLFLLLLLLTLNRCDSPRLQLEWRSTTTPAADVANARLRVDTQPAGAEVYVDGLRAGRTPVSMDLPSGAHDVRVELEGYEPLQQRIELVTGTEAGVGGELRRALESTTDTRTPKSTSAPAGSDGGLLPDLAIKGIKIELETGGSCDYSSTQLGIRLLVENVGDADAGSFVVDVNGVQQVIDTGLAAGKSISLWFQGYRRDGDNRIMLDSALEIGESDEGNNAVSQRLPIPTLPPPCTPAPAESPSGLATPPASSLNVQKAPPAGPVGFEATGCLAIEAGTFTAQCNLDNLPRTPLTLDKRSSARPVPWG